MSNHVQMHALRLAAAIAAVGCTLVCAGVSRAAEPTSADKVSGFIAGVRDSAADTSRRVASEALDALTKIQLGASTARELRPGLGIAGIDGEVRATLPVGAIIAAAVPGLQSGQGASLTANQHRLGLQDIAKAADHSFALDRAHANLGAEMGASAIEPSTFLDGNINRGLNTGMALMEHSYDSRDIGLAVPVPLLPDAHVEVAHYWWGERAFSPAVDGYRFALRYDVTKNLQFEGGNTQDSVRGSGGFFGLHYTKALDSRPAGVMPR